MTNQRITQEKFDYIIAKAIIDYVARGFEYLKIRDHVISLANEYNRAFIIKSSMFDYRHAKFEDEYLEYVRGHIENNRCPSCSRKLVAGLRNNYYYPCCSYVCWKLYKKSKNSPYNFNSYRELVLFRDRNTCRDCGKQFESKDLQIDHAIPRCLLGLHLSPLNLQTLCKKCHAKKTKNDIAIHYKVMKFVKRHLGWSYAPLGVERLI